MKFYRKEVLRFVRTHYEENEISLPQEQTTDATSKWNYYSDMHFIAPFRDKNSDPELERLIELAKPIVLRKNERKISSKEHSTAITIAAVSSSAATQTPAENVLMDIPAINEENMTEKEKCLRSFFDAIYRATLSLPLGLQNLVKRNTLEALNKAEILADAEIEGAPMEEEELET
ncbi:PREDICTED: uncharacterized protein LOC108377520 [Rhagoletis zephyria]|uniref:uncharacterized protein LOC108377520 n=1 Tax=Rhagoletis zephyria TaxID=28612 RepID=UPI000811A2D8|nr:PREDICTED: uncharacterized protein LOC108377520 [Rhagoletis zephyria]